MEPEPTVLDSLRKAVEAMPDDVPLRLHLATMLLQARQRDEAIRQLGAVLQRDPGNARALGLLRDTGPGPAEAEGEPAADHPVISAERAGSPAPAPAADADPGTAPHYDWSQAEDELRDVLPAMFVGDGEAADSASAGIDEADAYDAEHAGLTLADVAGMTEVKQRLEAAFLAPMRNPELRRLYGKSLRGGLLLYGPPGCGKTFIARAVAGELGARFIAVSFADIIDMFVGQSERNIHELFEIARRNAPCVLFLDEVDAIGQKRSQLRNTPMRSAVNQLLLELDDISGIDLARLARQTDGYSGADIAHICETAAERALMDSVRIGEPRMIGLGDLEAAIGEVKPSLGAWFDTARNVALFANENGSYDDLAAYLRKRRLI